jgi:hypothetical protein
MRARIHRIFLCMIVFAAMLQSGCGLSKQLGNNLVVEPLQWDRFSDRIGRRFRDRSLADEAWDEICNRDGDVYSRHYRRGFYEGFEDYLNAGGTGDPPVTPPRSYWRLYYQNPEGHQAMQDWFEGFRHGASIARASGIRDYVVVPLSSIPPKEITSDDQSDSEMSQDEKKEIPPGKEKMGPFPEQLPNKPSEKDGPVKPPITPPKTADGRPMPPPGPPIIQVERMIAPPVPNKSNIPK